MVGLGCLMRGVPLEVTVVLGEKDDMEVGVEAMLKGPGEPEYPVEGVAESVYSGVGGGRSTVARVGGMKLPTALNESALRISSFGMLVDVRGMAMPSTESGNGSPSTFRVSMTAVSS